MTIGGTHPTTKRVSSYWVYALLGFLLAYSFGNAGAADAHATPYGNSVDSSTSPAEIRYTTSSKYSGAVSNAISDWNALPGGVVIKPDAWNTYNDLEIYDVTSSDDFTGQFIWHPGGADNLRFNKRILDQSGWDACHEAKVGLHEFGHALDFDHNSLSWAESIMPQGKRCQDYLGTHDKSDYANRWA